MELSAQALLISSLVGQADFVCYSARLSQFCQTLSISQSNLIYTHSVSLNFEGFSQSDNVNVKFVKCIFNCTGFLVGPNQWFIVQTFLQLASHERTGLQAHSNDKS